MEFPKILVTVGTTKFEALVEVVQTDEVVDSLKKIGAKHVYVQMGHSKFQEGERSLKGLKFSFFSFRTEILSLIEEVDLIISHAGAGSSLDVLDQKKCLVVVPNDTLMGNHQAELAEYLHSHGYAVSATIQTLVDELQNLEHRFVKRKFLEPVDKTRLQKLLIDHILNKHDSGNNSIITLLFLSAIVLCFLIESFFKEN